MLFQALRRCTRQHTSIFRLRSHQHFNHTLTSTLEDENTVTPASDTNTRRTAFIRTWEPLHNLVEAWALIRAVERMCGTILEAQLLKDYEQCNQYQMNYYVVFVDPKSIYRIPNSGHTFHIPVSVMDERPGGLGLDDIEHLLEAEDRDESFEFKQQPPPVAERVITAQIVRSPRNVFTSPLKQSAVVANRALARSFLLWHGFHKLEPTPKLQRIAEIEWFQKPVWEQVRMRAAMQFCASVTRIRNPAILIPTTNENDGIELSSSPASTSEDSPKSSSPTTHKNDGEVSKSSPASMDLPESSSPTTLNNPSSHKSTSKSTRFHTSPSKLPQPSSLPLHKSTQHSSQSLPESTQLPPERTPPDPTILPPGQLTPEQRKAMQKQMSRAKQLVIKIKPPAAKKARKSKKEPEEKTKDQMLVESPKEPSDPASKGIVASFWKFLGR